MRSFGLLSLISAAVLGSASENPKRDAITAPCVETGKGFSCSDEGGISVEFHGFVLCCATADCDNDPKDVANIGNYCDITGAVPCIIIGYAECEGYTGSHYWVGDGYCDSNNNNEACGWDHGDCCAESCCPDQEYECGNNGYDCQDLNPKYTACGSGVDAGERTTVTQSSSAYDTRNAADGGCDPSGCTPALTRDQLWDDDSRWSCSEQLNNAQCTITYDFATAQDIGRLKIKFLKGDERVRSLRLTDNTGFETTITSSGTTSGWESFDISTDETSSLTMEAANLASTDWLSITEVEFMVD